MGEFTQATSGHRLQKGPAWAGGSVNGLVALMNGEIWVTSEPEVGVPAFGFELPRKWQVDAPTPAP